MSPSRTDADSDLPDRVASAGGRAGQAGGRPGIEDALRTALADTFIAVPQSRLSERLTALLASIPNADTDVFGEVRRLLGLLFRIEGRDVLAALRDDYHDFNPDLPPHASLGPGDLDAATYARLLDRLDRLLTQANFTRVDPDSLSRAERAVAEVDTEVAVPRHQYADVAFFARGRRHAVAERRQLFGLIRRESPAIRLRHVVVMIRFHDRIETPRRPLPISVGPRPVQRVFEGKMVIKLFTDVAEADLNMLYPGARAVMKLRDKLLLGVPALAGGVPILMNILPALSVLFVVAAAYLGLTAGEEVAHRDMAKSLAAISALAGLGGFLMRQWIKFERQVLKYQMLLTDNLYFRNVCNNAAVFDYLLGTAEDQEFKEALLAYVHILAAPGPLDAAGLKARVDDWLLDAFAVTVDFDIGDALDKLRRLDLLDESAAGALSVPPLATALTRLRARWHRQAGDMPDTETRLTRRGSTESAGLDAADGR